MGVAVYPDDGADFDTLLKKADAAMYKAKEAGRNTYRFYTGQMNTDALEHLRVRSGLRQALEQGQFVLHFQPQIDLASGRPVGAEALIRWQHPELGMLPPARFIGIAEDTGMIVPIGEWVLREACRQAAAWRKSSGMSDLVCAVNLSAPQFKRGNLEKSVASALAESGLDPACLELELTESILLQDTDNVLATVRRIKQIGVKLSIDDFGTGYSSLSYLKRFAVDKLKIDQSFVRGMADDPNDAAIVRAIIQMAHSLGLKTIAEGVEDERLRSLLLMHRCDEAQGYHFARPMPVAELLRYLSVPRAIAAGWHI
jgi:EAL domain-containing protein (putative c-di-GMP-specific phosphodiesterase class I)